MSQKAISFESADSNERDPRTARIEALLLERFESDGHRIVFWYDPGGDFVELLSSLRLDGVTVLRLDEHAALEVKIKLEIEDTEGRYLLYSPREEPAVQDDWLADIRLYSYTFHADLPTMQLTELGLPWGTSLRDHLQSRQKFLRSQERFKALKKWVSPDDAEGELDLKMLAVLVKAEQPDLFSVLMSVCDAFCDESTFNADEPPKVWEELAKFDLTAPFWSMVAVKFGYGSESAALSDLLIRLLVTDLENTLKVKTPDGLRHFVIADGRQAANASVFLSQWRTSVGHLKSYNVVSEHFAQELRIEDLLSAVSPGQLEDVMTFEVVEKSIISSLRDGISEGKEEGFAAIEAIIGRRRNGYWANTALGSTGKTRVYSGIYDAFEAAVGLFGLRQKYADGLSYATPEDMFQAYTRELYRFDQYYRLFCEAAGNVGQSGWDVLKSLKERVEACYGVWFMDQMALAWGAFLEPGVAPGLLQDWSLDEVRNQPEFFTAYVKKPLEQPLQSRVFVVVSDAFRYEAAEELAGQVSRRYRITAKLSAMLGVLPSITRLGMAALLPHETLSFKGPSSVDVLVDGEPAATIEQRAEVLARYKGTAIRAEDLLTMKKEQGRELVRPFEIIYVYHNWVDAVGDKAASASGTFEAVRKTINELDDLVSHIVNNLNGTQIVITSDHGFIYTDQAPESIDRSALDVKPSGALLAKKRFILGKKLGEDGKALHGLCKSTAGVEGDMEFWLPKGANRFHFAGGSRFFHGGAMLEEIVVPVVTVKGLSGKARAKTKARKVGVSLLGTRHRITTNIHRFEFVQTDAVASRVQRRTLAVSIRDDNELISSEETVAFDSDSLTMDDRKKSVTLRLSSRGYDSKRDYYLVLRDPESEIEYERIPVKIDLALTRDF